MVTEEEALSSSEEEVPQISEMQEGDKEEMIIVITVAFHSTVMEGKMAELRVRAAQLMVEMEAIKIPITAALLHFQITAMDGREEVHLQGV
jgi:hypothetical protein